MKKIQLALTLFITFFFLDCRKEEVPVLGTMDITDITSSSCRSGGDIISDGGQSILAKGVCWIAAHERWSTGQEPTIDDQKSTDGSGIESFTSNVTDLTTATTYYLRSYATTKYGTGYGPEKTFKTSEIAADIDGNVYEVVQIGTQTWMKDNLKVTRYRDGTVIPLTSNSSTWSSTSSGAYCAYGNSNYNIAVYGALYNWYAVTNPKGLCPTGWHIPSNEELTSLTTFLGGPEVAGGKMKETGLHYWNAPNMGVGNASGFSARAAGYRDLNGIFANLMEVDYIWSSSEYSPTHGISRKLYHDNSVISFSGNFKNSGFTVRCIRN